MVVVGAAAAVAAIQPEGKAPVGFHRVSVEKDDAGYVPYGMLVGDDKMVAVYLDGVKVQGVRTADAKEGWVKRYIRTPSGNIARVKADLLTEIVHGHVEIRVS